MITSKPLCKAGRIPFKLVLKEHKPLFALVEGCLGMLQLKNRKLLRAAVMGPVLPGFDQGKVRSQATFVPHPIEATQGTCHLSIKLMSPSGRYFAKAIAAARYLRMIAKIVPEVER